MKLEKKNSQKQRKRLSEWKLANLFVSMENCVETGEPRKGGWVGGRKGCEN